MKLLPTKNSLFGPTALLLWGLMAPTAALAAPTLRTLAVDGPSSVTEKTSASYTATATYSDGSRRVVTDSAVWSENSSYATIGAGVLATADVPSDQSVSVTARFASGRVTKIASIAVRVLNGTVPSVTGSHAGRFSIYEGTKTCLTCHSSEAYDVHASLHYQWKGETPAVVGANGQLMGKMGSINDFCIYPDNNWLGKLTNASGQQADGGCARCHVGLGAKPETAVSQAQLENIDCLLCHSAAYKRKLELVGGVLRFVPDAASMTVSVLQAASDLSLPDDKRCLNCHGKSGGGDNYKRGDLEMAHAAATADLDVHSARGVKCTTCHKVTRHRFSGRGVDMRATDSTTPVRCENCHASSPHATSALNRHSAGKVACATCHIPQFAKTAPTDMVRDWSKPGVLLPSTGLYEPDILFDGWVVPKYGFWNGTSTFYEFRTPATPGPNGRVLMAGPAGNINDPGAKLYPFKHHLGNQPADPVSRYLLPLKIGIFFSTGDVQAAIERGATEVFGAYNGHEFVPTERWIGIFHEVAPKSQALACADCHGGTRVDFKTLGYTPHPTRNGKPLCASCHGDESDEWSESELFAKVHEKHVKDKKLACSNCHAFSR